MVAMRKDPAAVRRLPDLDGWDLKSPWRQVRQRQNKSRVSEQIGEFDEHRIPGILLVALQCCQEYIPEQDLPPDMPGKLPGKFFIQQDGEIIEGQAAG